MIDGLGLVSPVLVGWSYGAAVVLDYLSRHNGLGAAAKALLVGGSPVLLAPGTIGGGGGDQVFGPQVPAAVFKTTEVNLFNPSTTTSYADVVGGMADFVQLALADSVPGRAAATRDEIVAATSFNLLLPPAARQAMITRQFDFRPFLAQLADSVKKKLLAVSGTADAVIQSANTTGYFNAAGVPVQSLAGEGHMPFARNAKGFNELLAGFVAS